MEEVRIQVQAAIIDHCTGADLYMASHIGSKKIVELLSAPGGGEPSGRVAVAQIQAAMKKAELGMGSYGRNYDGAILAGELNEIIVAAAHPQGQDGGVGK